MKSSNLFEYFDDLSKIQAKNQIDLLIHECLVLRKIFFYKMHLKLTHEKKKNNRGQLVG
jgi:hypothetical protein